MPATAQCAVTAIVMMTADVVWCRMMCMMQANEVMAPTCVSVGRREHTEGHDGQGNDDINTASHTCTSLYRTSLLVFKV